jgi:pyruvate,water dikinase
LNDLVLWLDQLRMTDLAKVGGKNASLGEMIGNLAKLGVSVPGGFATTADAFQQYLEKSGLAKRIRDRLEHLDVDDVGTLVAAGKEIRSWIVDTALPAELEQAIGEAYIKLCKDAGADDIAVPCGPRPPLKTCPMLRSPVSRKPSSTWSASMTCCTK